MEGRSVRCWLGALSIELAVAGGCATTQVTADYDPQVSFRQYRTFDVREGRVYSQGVPDPGDTLVRDRMEAAISAMLSRKGLREEDADPDLIVMYSAATARHVEVRYDPFVPWVDDWGSSWGGAYWSFHPYWASFSRSSYIVHEGAIAIDVIDTATKKVVYHTEARADDKNFRSPERLRKAVEKALARYPAPAA
jgi:hypothetical protein